MNIDWKIINRVLRGKASEEERELFEKWKRSGDSKAKESFLRDSALYYSGAGNEIPYVGSDKISSEWKKFQRKNRRSRTIYLYTSRIAAVALALVMLGLGGMLINDRYGETDLPKTVISKGEAQAVFIASDGSEYNLSAGKADVIKSKGFTATNIGNTLTFKEDSTRKSKVSVVKYNTIKVPRFGEYNLTLSDGTKVWLNAMSSLKFPNTFNGDNREVVVTGEAYFDVVHNDKPFVVRCKDVDVRVLGTEFNVRAYDEGIMETTLVRGSVEMSYTKDSKAKVLLYPGEKGIADSGKKNIRVEKANINSITAWKDGKFIFENESIEEIMNELSRWYDIDVFYQNNSVREDKFYVYIDRAEDFEKILKKLEMTNKIKIRVKGKNVVISE